MTEDIEGPGGGTVRMVVAAGRTVDAGLAGKFGPGAEIDVQRDDAGRMLELGFAYFPGDPRVGGVPLDQRTGRDPESPGLVNSVSR